MFGDFEIFVHYNINLQVQLQIYSTLKNTTTFSYVE